MEKSTRKHSGGGAPKAPVAAEKPAHAPSRGNAALQESVKNAGGTAPYSSKYASNQRSSAFSVDEGQLTFDAEGTEGGRFHSRGAHVPPGPSGVTIGRGYDLGQHGKAAIVEQMVAAGVAKSTAAAFSKAAGLKGDDARAWLKAHKSSLGEITPEQQEALFAATYKEMSGDVQRISDKSKVVESYGATDLENVHPGIRDTLVDLRYRGDYTGRAREKVQHAAAGGDLMGMTDAMSDKGAWKGVPPDRFARRKAYLQEQEEIQEYGMWSGGGPMAPELAEQFYHGKVKLDHGKAAGGKAAGALDGGAAQKVRGR